MKLSSLINKALSVVAITTVAAFGFCSQSYAAVFSGSSSGLWGIPDPGSNTKPYFTGVGNNAFTWGTALADIPWFTNKANSLTFKGTEFNTNFNSLFKIGELTYFNGIVDLNSSVEKVPLELEVSFKGRTAIAKYFDFDFKLVNVFNDLNKPIDSIDNADYVYIRPSFARSSFTDNGAEYTLELTGFSQDGGLTSVPEFRVVEGATTTAEIYGRITYVPPAEKVPEPGIVIGLSSLGVYMLARKNRS